MRMPGFAFALCVVILLSGCQSSTHQFYDADDPIEPPSTKAPAVSTGRPVLTPAVPDEEGAVLPEESVEQDEGDQADGAATPEPASRSETKSPAKAKEKPDPVSLLPRQTSPSTKPKTPEQGLPLRQNSQSPSRNDWFN